MRWTRVIAVPAAVVITMPAKATVYLTAEQAQRAMFPGASFTSAGRPGVWHVSTGGYFIVDRVVGKHEYITYALVSTETREPLIDGNAYSVIAATCIVADALTKVLAQVGNTDIPCFRQLGAVGLMTG